MKVTIKRPERKAIRLLKVGDTFLNVSGQVCIKMGSILQCRQNVMNLETAMCFHSHPENVVDLVSVKVVDLVSVETAECSCTL